jgi:hypothetical protein
MRNLMTIRLEKAVKDVTKNGEIKKNPMIK